MTDWKDDLIPDLIDQKKHLIIYLESKTTAGDWHAVQDAASDIREINAKLIILRLLRKTEGEEND